MAISSISGTTYGSSSVTMRLPTTACPTCGGSAARTSTAQAFSNGYTGRTDSYTCATCGQQKATTSRTTTSSSYCPTCSGNSLARSVSSFPSTVGNTSSCPTCGKGQTSGNSTLSRTGTTYTNNTTAWAR